MNRAIRTKGVRSCRMCGCTDLHACEGGCYWVKRDLCSRCERDGLATEIADESARSMIECNTIPVDIGPQRKSVRWYDLSTADKDDRYLKDCMRYAELRGLVIHHAHQPALVCFKVAK